LRICNYFFLASVLTAEVKHLEFSTKTTGAKAAYQDKRVMVEVFEVDLVGMHPHL
jgi:hypothetical protein